MQIGSRENSIILDFFAGSGTTGQAVLELNKNDNGSRTFILCTNNEIKEDIIKQYVIEHNYIDNTKQFNPFKESEEYKKIFE